jgi:hypothetical protein
LARPRFEGVPRTVGLRKGHERDGLFAEAPGDRLEQILLRPEVVVEGALGQAGFGDHIVDRRALVAFAHEQPLRAVEQFGATDRGRLDHSPLSECEHI